MDALNANLTDRRMRVVLLSDVTDWIIDITCKDRSMGAAAPPGHQRYRRSAGRRTDHGHLQGGAWIYLENGHLTAARRASPLRQAAASRRTSDQGTRRRDWGGP
jgi:hypothetical protein